MTSRLRSKYYRRRKLFVADLRSIISNCKLFNEPDTEYYKCAVELEEFVDDLLRDSELDDWYVNTNSMLSFSTSFKVAN